MLTAGAGVTVAHSEQAAATSIFLQPSTLIFESLLTSLQYRVHVCVASYRCNGVLLDLLVSLEFLNAEKIRPLSGLQHQAKLSLNPALKSVDNLTYTYIEVMVNIKECHIRRT